MSLLLAGLSFAGEQAGDGVPAPALDEPVLEAQVSTSPTEERIGVRPNSTLPFDDGSSLRPLTRAAAQKQIEEMSPMLWLSSFGPVVVGPASPAN